MVFSFIAHGRQHLRKCAAGNWCQMFLFNMPLLKAYLSYANSSVIEGYTNLFENNFHNQLTLQTSLPQLTVLSQVMIHNYRGWVHKKASPIIECSQDLQRWRKTMFHNLKRFQAKSAITPFSMWSLGLPPSPVFSSCSSAWSSNLIYKMWSTARNAIKRDVNPLFGIDYEGEEAENEDPRPAGPAVWQKSDLRQAGCNNDALPKKCLILQTFTPTCQYFYTDISVISVTTLK